jgi:hypothetical protein
LPEYPIEIIIYQNVYTKDIILINELYKRYVMRSYDMTREMNEYIPSMDVMDKANDLFEFHNKPAWNKNHAIHCLDWVDKPTFYKLIIALLKELIPKDINVREIILIRKELLSRHIDLETLNNDRERI